jgi:hypothetical protein
MQGWFDQYLSCTHGARHALRSSAGGADAIGREDEMGVSIGGQERCRNERADGKRAENAQNS